MKSYLSLIPISSKVRRRQNKLTNLCIILAVFMVTAIFSMAEMNVRMEVSRLENKHVGFSLSGVLHSTMAQTMMLTAGVLFLLVLVAGVLMISSSMNSSVAQRMQFFGMLRCIGMSRRQVIRYVRLEALNWCKTAVPIGVALGILASWALCAALRFLVGEEFAAIPLFGISLIGIISGALTGIATVLLAAGVPARRAAGVSPVAAASGNVEMEGTPRRVLHTGFFRIETALGIHHAMGDRKNLFLVTGSFALSIALFLSFSVLIDFIDHLLPQSAAKSDIDIVSAGETNDINPALVETIAGMRGVKRVYGRRCLFDVPAMLDTAESGNVDLISFEDFDLKALQTDGALRRGSDLSAVFGDSSKVLATADPYSTWGIGDKILVGTQTLTIAGLLRYDPFSADGLTGGKITLITSDETFTRLTGISDYAMVMIQTTPDATDADAAAIKGLVTGSGYVVNDKRDEQTSGTYHAFVFCVYCFLAVIALVAVMNIVNSISMSVSSRIRQYGAMLAVGMDGRQLARMILAEAMTYAVLGCVAGCAVGIPVSRAIYQFLITDHFPYALWSLSLWQLAVMVLSVIGSAVLATYFPARRLRKIPVRETINAL